jgi:phospholipase C
MLVVSPWSKGGYVNSQLFDHTSLIRFIEQRFASAGAVLTETNITPWRRCVSGDLTSAFNFKTPNAHVPALPATSAYVPPNGDRQPSYTPVPPGTQSLPAQEVGQRPARALPYQFNVNATTHGVGLVQIAFQNTGTVGAVFQVRAGGGAFAPRTYTLAPGTSLADTWNLSQSGLTAYDLAVYGPNGFLRRFQGGLVEGASAGLLVFTRYDTKTYGLITEVVNDGVAVVTLAAQNLYSGEHFTQALAPGAVMLKNWSLASAAGWYDVILTVDSDPAFAWRHAGHLENGQDYVSDPGINNGL